MEFRSLFFAACSVLLAAGSALGQTVGNCQMFPLDHALNTPVDHLPTHALSSTWVNTIGATRTFHGDFSHEGGGIPYVAVRNQPKVAVTLASSESDPGPYPIPPNAPVELGDDKHVLVVDETDCKLYEMFDARRNADNTWWASSGAVFTLGNYALRPYGWTSADAAGLPILPLLIRYEEILAGEIKHALRFTAPQTKREFLWPARHFASNLTDAQYPPMGARFRLKADFNISSFDPRVQVILRAMKKYGIILADNGSSWYVTGAPDPRWDMSIMNFYGLKRLKGSDFEAVDTSTMMIETNSAKARQPNTAPPPAPVPVPTISSLTANAVTIPAGGSATFTVMLSSDARATGENVTLSSSTTVLTMPSSVSVASGQRTANFTATAATSVSTAQQALVTATANGSSQNRVLTVEATPVAPAPPVVAPPPVTPPAVSFTPIRVNFGCGQYQDVQGRVWANDRVNRNDGSYTYRAPLNTSGTSDPMLYQCIRYGTPDYSFNVPNGNVRVRLLFNEPLTTIGAGQRLFHILLNGQRVETDLDISVLANGRNAAAEKSYTIAVTNGQVRFQLQRNRNWPMVSAIEITPAQ
jgi:hypothetical protein